LPTRALDEYLLTALEHGLPPCSGVAVGFDRLLMVASDAQHIRDVMTFTTEHA
jgi:lysyl-tRNA synthetase class 2